MVCDANVWSSETRCRICSSFVFPPANESSLRGAGSAALRRTRRQAAATPWKRRSSAVEDQRLPLGQRQRNICTNLEFTLIIACCRIRRCHLPLRHLLPQLRCSSTQIVWGIVRRISLTRCWIYFFRPNNKNSSLGGKNLLTCTGCATPWTAFFPPWSGVTEVLNLRNPAGALSPPEAFWVSCRFNDWLLRTNTLTWWRNLSQSKMIKAAADTPS